MNLDPLQEWVREMALRARDTRPLMAFIAKSMEVAYRRHFAAREAEGNKQGWPQRHFWNREVARYLKHSYTSTEAVITIASPAYMHKVHGGKITPKRGRALAIPQSARAYAAGSPRISGLPLVFIPDLSRKVVGWLIEHEMYRIGLKTKKGYRLANKKTVGTIHYMLVGGVNQAADPRAEPTTEAVEAVVRENIESWIKLLGTEAGTAAGGA